MSLKSCSVIWTIREAYLFLSPGEMESMSPTTASGILSSPNIPLQHLSQVLNAPSQQTIWSAEEIR